MRRRTALAGVGLVVLPFVLGACGQNGPTQTGEPPTRDWPDEIECPSSLSSVCADGRLTVYATINQPEGTNYGVASSEDEVFVLCRWPEGSAAATCDEIAATGAQVFGEAAVYRVED